MDNVTINVNFDSVMEKIQEIVDKMLAVADEVPAIIKDRAILENEDVDGNQMNRKVPRPTKSPTNFPDLPLIQNDDPNLMDNARWHVERTDLTTATVVYSPPEHLKYLIEKDPEHGGRKWITPDKINPNAVAEIQKRMIEAVEE